MLQHLSTASSRLASAGPATAMTATAQALKAAGLSLPDDYIPPTQPPSLRRAENRKAQMIRTYTSLLRSTPLILFYQHNNLTAVEWTAVRRELRAALSAVPPVTVPNSSDKLDLTFLIDLKVLSLGTFRNALKVVEFFDPAAAASKPTTPRTRIHGPLVHDLSVTAFESLKDLEAPEDSVYAQLEPLLTGPVAALVFPVVSPAHLAAALSVLSPSPPHFPAPKRKARPGYHEPIVQNALAKLFLIGGRIEGKVFDTQGIEWVGGIQGGLDGLRAQLVNVLQGAGLSLSTTLESAGKSLWVSLESRRISMEEEQQGGSKADAAGDTGEASQKDTAA